jgi:hypothetical protein
MRERARALPVSSPIESAALGTGLSGRIPGMERRGLNGLLTWVDETRRRLPHLIDDPLPDVIYKAHSVAFGRPMWTFR